MEENLQEKTEAVSRTDAVSDKETVLEEQPQQVNKLYENFRHIPLKYLDRFIAGCIILLVLVMVIGIFQAVH
jgi:hypothetical protein